ncbi:MAG: alpha/beta hydrolase [Sphingobacteriales bacterium]|nr:MAG: alpha/beta hydrolase [Sphingobacteriales bacterium]
MLHYHKVGNGKPVVLVHGFPNDSSTWDTILPMLSTSYQYIIPDLPGAGKSAPVEDLSLEKMARAILEILDKESIEKAIWTGHSMGGYTIMEATQHFPERMQAISLVHSLASADNEEKKEARRKSIKLLQNGTSGKSIFLKAMAENLFAEVFKTQHPEAAAAVAEKGMELPAETLAAFYNAIMQRSDKTNWLKTNNNIPVQWIIGSEDNATPMKEGLEQCHLSFLNEVQLYRSVGHMSMMETPERLAQDLNSFFDFAWNRK